MATCGLGRHPGHEGEFLGGQRTPVHQGRQDVGAARISDQSADLGQVEIEQSHGCKTGVHVLEFPTSFRPAPRQLTNGRARRDRGAAASAQNWPRPLPSTSRPSHYVGGVNTTFHSELCTCARTNGLSDSRSARRLMVPSTPCIVSRLARPSRSFRRSAVTLAGVGTMPCCSITRLTV